jgi:hypothetical protein
MRAVPSPSGERSKTVVAPKLDMLDLRVAPRNRLEALKGVATGTAPRSIGSRSRPAWKGLQGDHREFWGCRRPPPNDAPAQNALGDFGLETDFGSGQRFIFDNFSICRGEAVNRWGGARLVGTADDGVGE